MPPFYPPASAPAFKERLCRYVEMRCRCRAEFLQCRRSPTCFAFAFFFIRFVTCLPPAAAFSVRDSVRNGADMICAVRMVRHALWRCRETPPSMLAKSVYAARKECMPGVIETRVCSPQYAEVRA